ncbi:MAG: site-2 protease family protein [Candidatus Saccharimonadales bacterium]
MMNIDLTYLLIVLGSILISMTLHEAMHAFASYWLGDDTAKALGRLTINPIAHIDPFTTVLLPLMLAAIGAPPFGAAKPVPFNPYRLRYGEYGSAIVGAAGPLTNLALAILAGLVIRLFGAELDGGLLVALGTFTLVNLAFFIFNMIPFPPLDGSRVLYAFAPDGVRRVMERIESMGFAAIIFFMLIFFAVLSEPFVRVLQGALALITGGYVTF